MITDIEEESKTKFSMGVEFTFLLKALKFLYVKVLKHSAGYVILNPEQ